MMVEGVRLRTHRRYHVNDDGLNFVGSRNISKDS